MKPILITCYVNPDLDGYAGVVAYAELLAKRGPEVTAGIIGKLHDETNYVIDRFKLTRAKSIANDSEFEKVILVDASDTNGLENKIDPAKVIEIIDHRKVHEADKFPGAKIQIEPVGAAATLIAEKFKEINSDISPESAILLYSAIISNTLNFRGSVTTGRDREAANWLRRSLTIPGNYWLELFSAKSDLSGKKLTERINGDLAWFIIGGQKIGIAQLEIIGADELVGSREKEIISILKDIETDYGLDFIFLNIIELKEEKNYFLTDNGQIKMILEKILKIRFRNNIAERNGLIMRKQIVPLIKEELEKNQTNIQTR
jgi:manganese-dependent inorganic pyrophosphatase